MTTPENATNVASYQWYEGTDPTAVVNALAGETNKTLTVTSTMVGSYLKVIATDDQGNTFESPVTTEAITSTELALKSVESADLGTNTYLIAYFNKSVGDLQPGDIEIRRVDTNTLVTVEKVTMSSDKMTANLTLVGAGTAAGGAQLTANVDYKMIVKTSDGTAEKVFSIPAVASNLTVRSVNETKKTITTAAGTFFVPTEMGVDYEEILGRTVTIEYNKDMNLTKLNMKDETVVYGAFVVSNGTGADDAVLVDQITGEKYDDQETVAGSSEITATYLIQRTTSGVSGTASYDFDTLTDKTDAFAYAKLILNSNGTVKTMVTCPAWSQADAVAQGNVLVSKVVGTSVYGGTTPVDMKDYLIVKDGKKIAIEDIVEGDVVFFNTNFKYAEVYNDVRTGALSAVYDGRFTFDGKTYNTTAAATVPANLVYASRYIKDNGGMTAVDNDYMNALKASGEDITVYFDRAGQPVFISGTTGTVVTNDIQVVLTENAKLYKQSLADYIRIKGFNGTEIKTYDIDISGLTKIDDGTRVFEKGYTPYASGATAATRTAAADTSAMTAAQKHGGFAIAADGDGTTDFVANTGAGTINQNHGDGSAPANAAQGKDALITITNVAAGKLAKKSVVTLTTDDKGKVIAINYEDQAVASNCFEAGKAFKGGLSKVTDLTPATYQISATTPIYTYDNDKDTVKKVDYSEFTAATKAADAVAGSQGVHIYSMDEKNVSWVVIDSQALDTDSTGETTVEAVVSEVEYSADSDKKMVKLTLLTADGAEATTYTKFGKDIKTSGTIAVGEIVTVKVASDGETVNDAAVDADKVAGAVLSVTDVAKTEFTTIESDGTTTHTGLALASSVTPLIVKITDTNTVEKINFAELATLSRTNKVNYSILTSAYVDTIVVTQTAGGSDAYNNAVTDVDAFLTAANVKAVVGAIVETAEGKAGGSHMTTTEIATWLTTAANVKTPIVDAFNASATKGTVVTAANVTVAATSGDGQTAATDAANGVYKVAITITVGGYSATVTVTDGVVTTSGAA